MRQTAMIRSLLTVVALALALPASAQVYRCEIDDTLVFSDQPCEEGAAEHMPARGISIVAPSDDLAETSRRNQEFIRDRLDRQAAAREAAAERAAQARRFDQMAPQQPAAHAPGFRHVPYFVAPPPRGKAPARRPADPPGQSERRRNRSPLSGPFPGTSREARRQLEELHDGQ